MFPSRFVSLWKSAAPPVLLASSDPRGTRRRRRRVLRAAIEQLEDRRLLSAMPIQSDPSDAFPTSLQVNQGEYAPDRVLVRAGASIAAVDRFLGPAATSASALGQSQWWTVQIGAGHTAPEVVAKLQDRGFDAQLDYVVSIADHSADSDFKATNDYLYTSRMQWGLNNTGQDYGGATGIHGADIKAPGAWSITTGSSSVVVAVIDSGVDYTHPDLKENMWQNLAETPDNGRDDDGNGYIDDVYGWDFYNGDANPMDDNGHGTHVAGILGAVGNYTDAAPGGQDGRGVAGVAWDVSIMALKFLSASGSGYASGAIAALDYATMMRQRYDDGDIATSGANVRVANNSWGGGAYDDALKSAIDRSGEAGILFTAAAGNGHWLFGYGLNNDADPHYPSSYESANIVAVAATDANDKLTSFSNWGATSVDLAAPGQHIWSTWPIALDTQDGTQEGYYRANGTSMATPFVSGTAALIWSANPDLSVAEVKQILLSSTDSIGNDQYDKPTVTNGRLNAHKAVAEANRLATPQLSISDVVVVEGSGDPLAPVYANFTVTRSGRTSEIVTVDYQTTDNTATAGKDYMSAVGKLTFGSGETSKVISVPILDDAIEELSETFFVNLTAPSGAIVADSQGTGTITDDDDTKPVGNSNDLYVADMTWASGYNRREKNWTDVKIYVKRDADADGTGGAADDGDASVAGASVSLLLIHDSNGDGDFDDTDDKQWTGTADTLADGTVTFTVTKGPSSGDFKAEVRQLSHSANASYTWNRQLDGENPDLYRRGVGELEAKTSGASIGENIPGETVPSRGDRGHAERDDHAEPVADSAKSAPSDSTTDRGSRSSGRTAAVSTDADDSGRDAERPLNALEARDRFFAEHWQELIGEI